MEWTAYADEIRQVLDLKGNPVAITYSMTAPSIPSVGKNRMCRALQQAHDGRVIDLTGPTSTCPGGTWYLGLGELPKGDRDKALKSWSTARKCTALSLPSTGYEH